MRIGWAPSALACLGAGLAAIGVGLTPPAWAEEEGARFFDIDPQPLSRALLEFARQAHVEVLVEHDALGGFRSQRVRGRFEPDAALALLLQGTGFEGEVRDGAVRLRARRNDAVRERPRAMEGSAATLSEAIVVVGSHIRGLYPTSSPVDLYGAEDIARSGATSTEQFVDALTQNLDTRTQFGIGAVTALNREGVNGIDLRGLGVGASLVLYDGRRLALASEGQVVDLSLIPLGAIARVEVLTDGASAIYGSDAIGGVVNFVSRRGFEGHESRFDLGAVSDGGLRQGGITHTIGEVWQGGEAFLSFSARSASALARRERGYPAPSGRGDLAPDEVRYGLVAGAAFEATPRLTLSADVLAGSRRLKSEYGFLNAGPASLVTSNAEMVFASVSGSFAWTPRTRATLTSSYSTRNDDVSEIVETPVSLNAARTHFDYVSFDTTAVVGGRVGFADLPVSYSIGVGRAEENYRTRLTMGELAQTNTYAFAEAFVPLIDEADNASWAKRFEFNAALRYSEYTDQSAPRLRNDFGERVNGKIGLFWAPVDWLGLRGSFSQSFRAPSLSELDPRRSVNALVNFPLRGQNTVVLGVFGPSALKPETADTFTFGFELDPPSSSFRLRGTYFNISYHDRVAMPDPTLGIAALSDPDGYGDIVFAPPSTAFIEDLLTSTSNVGNTSGVNLSDARVAAAQLAGLANFVVFDDRLRNLAAVSVDGFDLDVAYGFSRLWGDWNLGARLTFIADYNEQVSANAPIVTLVDTVLRPVDLRGTAFIELLAEPFEASLSLNYVDDYRNPYAQDAQSIASWTTWDARVGFAFAPGSQVHVAIKNVFDEPAPYVAASLFPGQGLQGPIGFDPANANPLGRLLSIELVKQW